MSVLNIDDKTVGIVLSNGSVTILDRADLPKVQDLKWHEQKGYNGVTYATSSRKRFLMHRLIVGITDPKLPIDHWDGDGLNNRRSNIRVSTTSSNLANSSSRGGSSKYKGVHKKRSQWVASISRNGKKIVLGSYTHEQHAAAAYDVAAVSIFGEFARINLTGPLRGRDGTYKKIRQRVGEVLARHGFALGKVPRKSNAASAVTTEVESRSRVTEIAATENKQLKAA